MSYIKTWKRIILRPSNFYMEMTTTGEYADPLTFAAISLVISWLISVLVSFGLLTIHGSEVSFSILGSISVLMGIGLILIFVSLFILALIANLLYKALGGTGNYEGTVKSWLYASAALIFLTVPYIVAVAIPYTYYLLIVGGMIVHNVSIRVSIISVLLSIVLLAMFVWMLTIFTSLAH